MGNVHSKAPSVDALTRQLFPDIHKSFYAYRNVKLPPHERSFQEVLERVLSAPKVVEAIEKSAEDQLVPVEEMHARARAILTKMAADPNRNVIRAFVYSLKKVLDRMCSGVHVDMEGLQRLKDLYGTIPMVLLPTHKSHIDYLIISYVCLMYGMEVPYIAAGENLSFMGANFVFKHSGAFFIRRSFGNDELYKAIFDTYLLQLLQDRNSVELFIEGTRSRSGKLLRPRMGMMSMMTDAILENELEDLLCCPVAVQYEKVMEGETYSNELLGRSKQQESLAMLIQNSTSIFKVHFGSIHIRFAAPFRLRSYVDSLIADRDLHPMESEADRKKLVSNVSYRVVYDLNRTLVAMPAAMVAAIVLSFPGRAMPVEELITQYQWLGKQITLRGGSVALFDKPIPEITSRTITFLRKCFVKDARKKGFLEVGPLAKQSLQLGFYRNQIIHIFIPEAMLAVTLNMLARARDHTDVLEHATLKGTNIVLSMEEIVPHMRFLSQLMKFEFVFEPTRNLEENILKALDHLQTMGIVSSFDETTISLSLAGMRSWPFAFLCGLAWPFLDSYWSGLVSLFVLFPRRCTMQKLLLQDMRNVAEALYYQGVLSYLGEGMSEDTLLNIITFFDERGLIQIRSQPGRSQRDSLITLSEEFQHREALIALGEQIHCFRRQDDELKRMGILDVDRVVGFVESKVLSLQAKL